jgi:fermentation-respiration switch protein FrsA (DUF1100 family)
MWGHSMGGFLTLRAMVISPDIKAGVIWSGVVGSYPDMICCWHHHVVGLPTTTQNPNFRSGWRTRWQNIYGSPEANPTFWMSISVNSYLKYLSGPIQLHAGTGEEEVPIKFSQDLHQEVQAAGKKVEYFEYPEDNHNLSNYFNLARSVRSSFLMCIKEPGMRYSSECFIVEAQSRFARTPNMEFRKNKKLRRLFLPRFARCIGRQVRCSLPLAKNSLDIANKRHY